MAAGRKRPVADTSRETSSGPDASWFVRDRFGMFIHWGLYSLAARHEWVKKRERITDEQYRRYFERFDPDLYDPKLWARAAKDAHMRYVVVTSKHHEGFCLWDSDYTDYKATNTPCGRDLLAPLLDAFRDEGLRVGLYYSLLDWRHEQFPIDLHHPMSDDAEFRKANADRDVRKYAQYVRDQVTELLTKYGPIDYLWYDFSYPGPDGKGRDDWGSVELLKLTRKLQPTILINDRLDLLDTPGGWDVRTTEQVMVREAPRAGGKPVLWETCQTFSGSWGYHRDESTWKSVRQLLYLLIDTVSKGGNLLLNVGPTARGTFDARAMERLAGIGAWMRLCARSIEGCGPAPEEFPSPRDCRLTYNAETKRLYVHVLNWPIRHLHLDNLAGRIAYAQLLHDAGEVRFLDAPADGPETHKPSGAERTLTLVLPVVRPNVAVPVIELFLK